MRMLKALSQALGLAIAAALLAACAANGVAKNPGVTQANLAANKLQFAVGTARIGQDGTVGVNFVSTLRQPNGLSGPLANNPRITGPAGFVVPAGAGGAYSSAGANLDAGTNHISSSPQVPLNNAGLVNTTLGTFSGVYSYGLGPFNSDQSTVSGGYYPGSPNATAGNGFTSSNYDGTSMVAAVAGFDEIQPLPYFSADPMEYITGPPAVPFFNDGTFPSFFAGYAPGFTPVEIAPVAGTYSLSVHVAAQNAAAFTYAQNATLASAAALPALPAPTFAGDGAGGGNGTVNVPGGVTETMVYIVDASAGPQFYAIGPLAGTGALPFVLPDHLGPCIGSGCQNSANATNSLNTGDTYFISAVGFDYPAFQAGPPANRQQTPVIVGANGQADITMSPVVQATY